MKDPLDPKTLCRRGLLASGALGAMSALQVLSARERAFVRSGASTSSVGYGPLAPVPDETTGLPLLQLPSGFRYATFGWTGDRMTDGVPTPPRHDGMAVVTLAQGIVGLVRNHEVRGLGMPFGTDPSVVYDPRAGGGTTTLLFQLQQGRWIGSRTSLSGTVANCAGGPTPWGSWLSAEESLDGVPEGFSRAHGFVFEVPGRLPTRPVPLRDMGRFSHEAVAVDPRTGFVYLTEDDRFTSGLYRFRPNKPNRPYGLEQGGVLEMLRVRGDRKASLQVVRRGDSFDVAWVEIPQPALGPQRNVGPFSGIDGQTTSSSGPFLQGFDQGAARFRRLEGIAYDKTSGLLYFVDTEGGRRSNDTRNPEGTVWCYDPVAERLEVIYESRSTSALENADNITVSPRGGLLLCEDGSRVGQRLKGLTQTGELFNFARNDVVLNGEVNGIVGDFRGSEWAGVCFDREGTWLFVNVQNPGFTAAITGPWGQGGL